MQYDRGTLGVVRRKTTCALCHTRPSSNAGEHVAPQWFTKMFSVSDGPYTVSINGKPVLKNDQTTPRTYGNFGAYKLACCVDCNGSLNRRFETDATRTAIKSLFDDRGGGVWSREEHRAAALWLLKTWLLLAHEKTEVYPKEMSTPQWTHVPALYRWMTHGAEPPRDLSLWIYRHNDVIETDPLHLPLPALVSSRRTYRVQVNVMSVKKIGIVLLHHPGWRVDLPRQVQNKMRRLWPCGRATQLDLDDLPSQKLWPISWYVGPRIQLMSGWDLRSIRRTLPPLGSAVLELPVPGIQAVSG